MLAGHRRARRRQRTGDLGRPHPETLALDRPGPLRCFRGRLQTAAEPDPPPPSREERARRRQERERSVLLMALNKYAKENNIQPSELQLVEVKATNYIYEYTGEYLHYNLLVRSGSDCTQPTMFFAEVKPGCQGEEDVYLCTPLQETNNKGPCFSCKHRAKDLMHPVGGGYLGGHKKRVALTLICWIVMTMNTCNG